MPFWCSTSCHPGSAAITGGGWAAAGSASASTNEAAAINQARVVHLMGPYRSFVVAD